MWHERRSRELRVGERSEPARGLAREMPDLSLARCARRLVTRGFAARVTSFITTKMRACSQANMFPFHLMNCSLNVVYRFSFMTKEADFGVATWISQNLAIEYVIFKSSRVVQL